MNPSTVFFSSKDLMFTSRESHDEYPLKHRYQLKSAGTGSVVGVRALIISFPISGN